MFLVESDKTSVCCSSQFADDNSYYFEIWTYRPTAIWLISMSCVIFLPCLVMLARMIIIQENGVKKLGRREPGVKKTKKNWEQGAKEFFLQSREQRRLQNIILWFREHAKLIGGAVIKKTWGTGSRGLNSEGGGGPPCRASVFTA